MKAHEMYSQIGGKTLQKLLKTPNFVQTLTPVQFEGMKLRVETARWQPEERIVYDAVQDGYASMDSLPVATGLSSTEVGRAVESLTKKGYLTALKDGSFEGKKLI